MIPARQRVEELGNRPCDATEPISKTIVMRADGGSVPGLSPGTPILATTLPKELPWIGLRPRTGGRG